MLSISSFLKKNPLENFLWSFFNDIFDVPSLTPQRITFHLSSESDIFNLMNHLLLVLKYSVPNALKNNCLNAQLLSLKL